MSSKLLKLENCSIKNDNNHCLIIYYKEYQAKDVSIKRASIIEEKLESINYLSNRNIKFILNKKKNNIQWFFSRLLFLKSLKKGVIKLPN